MNARDFVELVKELRAEQKEYYKGRNVLHLMEARRLERQVDKVLLEGIEFPIEAHLEQMDGLPGEGQQIGMLMEDDDEAQAQ